MPDRAQARRQAGHEAVAVVRDVSNGDGHAGLNADMAHQSPRRRKGFSQTSI
jgi:hypothetical protein